MEPMAFLPEKRYARLTPGKVVRMLREVSEMTQVELAKKSGLTQSAISAIENETTPIGLERIVRLAKALDVHPGLIAFPNERPRPGSRDLRTKEQKSQAAGRVSGRKRK